MQHKDAKLTIAARLRGKLDGILDALKIQHAADETTMLLLGQLDAYTEDLFNNLVDTLDGGPRLAKVDDIIETVEAREEREIGRIRLALLKAHGVTSTAGMIRFLVPSLISTLKLGALLKVDPNTIWTVCAGGEPGEPLEKKFRETFLALNNKE